MKLPVLSTLPLPWKLGIGAIAFTLSASLGWRAHDLIVYEPHLLADEKAANRAIAAIDRLRDKALAISTSARNKLDTKQEAIRVVTRTLTKAIPLYVPEGQGLVCGPQGVVPGQPRASDPVGGRGDPAAPVLPNGFVRLHDYAALGEAPPVPPAPGLDITGPSGVGLPQLSTTLVGNYGMALEWRAEVLAWRAWYVDQAALWEKARASAK